MLTHSAASKILRLIIKHYYFSWIKEQQIEWWITQVCFRVKKNPAPWWNPRYFVIVSWLDVCLYTTGFNPKYINIYSCFTSKKSPFLQEKPTRNLSPIPSFMHGTLFGVYLLQHKIFYFQQDILQVQPPSCLWLENKTGLSTIIHCMGNSARVIGK